MSTYIVGKPGIFKVGDGIRGGTPPFQYSDFPFEAVPFHVLGIGVEKVGGGVVKGLFEGNKLKLVPFHLPQTLSWLVITEAAAAAATTTIAAAATAVASSAAASSKTTSTTITPSKATTATSAVKARTGSAPAAPAAKSSAPSSTISKASSRHVFDLLDIGSSVLFIYYLLHL